MRDVFAGVDVGGTRIKIGIGDSSGNLISAEVHETKSYHGAESFLDLVSFAIKSLASKVSAEITAAGIGCPGRINFTSGKVVWLKGKLEFLEGLPLATQLSKRLSCPVVCDNDVNAILAGEMRFGAGRGYRDVVGITVGTGIGGALVIDGKMVRGHNWATGHFGYMSLDPHGRGHVCGNTGTVEEFASQSGILREIHRALGEGEISVLTKSLATGVEPGLRELLEAADAGDKLGRHLTKQLTSSLGVMIANLIYSIDPELVLVGGGIVTHRPEILDAIRIEVASRLDFLADASAPIERITLGDTAGVLGGVALALDAIAKTKLGRCAQGRK